MLDCAPMHTTVILTALACFARPQPAALEAKIDVSNLVRLDDKELDRALDKLDIRLRFDTAGRPLVWLAPRMVAVLKQERMVVAIDEPGGPREPADRDFSVSIDWKASDIFERPAGYPSHRYLDPLLGPVIPIKVIKDVGSLRAGEVIFVSPPTVNAGPGWAVLRQLGRQTPQAPPKAQATSVRPQVRSSQEADALLTVFKTSDPDARIAAAQNALLRFPETEFKTVVLQVIAASYQQKNDFENMATYSVLVLQADPQNYLAMLMLASGLAQRAQESDPAREEKLEGAERFARGAIELVKTASKPRPDLPDAAWEQAKRDFISQGREVLGLVALQRKNFEVAVTELEAAVKSAANPDPKIAVELAAAYNGSGRYSEAIAILDKVLADPNLHPRIRQFAQTERARAGKGRGLAPR